MNAVVILIELMNRKEKMVKPALRVNVFITVKFYNEEFTVLHLVLKYINGFTKDWNYILMNN